MKNLSLIFISILLLLSTAFGAEIQSEFHIVDSDQVVKEGDIVEGILKIWPLENADIGEFKNLQEKILFDAFYLTDIQSVGPSENNADVVEMKAWFIVQGSKGLTDQVFSYKGRTILIHAPNVKIEKLGIDKDDYYIMNQSISYSSTTQVIFGVVVFLIIALVILKRKKLSSLFHKYKYDPKKEAIKKFRDLFSKAQSREDFEKIYSLKNDWYEFIEMKAPAYNEFFRLMETHQYKRSWSTEEINEVATGFDVIRGSFK